MHTTTSNHKESAHNLPQQAKKALSVLPTGKRLLTKARRGTKQGEGKHYLEPKNLLTPEEAQTRVINGGNYGFRLGNIPNQDWVLAVFDVEIANALPEPVSQWVDRYALLQWESLHNGSNRLIKATPEAYTLLDQLPSEINFKDDGRTELEILTPERAHALGPGSVVEHCHCSKQKPCDRNGEGYYRLENLSQTAPVVDTEEVEYLSNKLDSKTTIQTQTSQSEAEVEGSNKTSTNIDSSLEGTNDLDTRILRRLERAEEFEFGDQFVALKEGRYKDAGFPNDRSEAECRLVEILAWLFDDDKQDVKQAMTAICLEHPQTDAGIRKWLEREEKYRELTVDAVTPHKSTYDEPRFRPYQYKPEVGYVLIQKVYDTIWELRLASTAQIIQHENVDRSQRQVQRALTHLEEEETIQYTRKGRKVRYYIDKEFVPEELCEEYQL